MGFTGIDFGTLAPILSVFSADGNAAWQARLPGTVRESWARGALSATSADGELAAFGIPLVDPAAHIEQAHVLVWDISTSPAKTLVNDSFAQGTGIEAVLQSDFLPHLSSVVELLQVGSSEE